MRKTGLILLMVGAAMLAAGCASSTATVEPLDAVTPEPTEELTASVSVNDQDAADGTVTISEVNAVQPGWLVVHATRNGGPGPVLGYSPVQVGRNENVQVEIDLSQATGQLFAMLHLDAGTVGTYEFPGNDAPVFVDDVMVNVPFQASFPIEPAVTVSDQASSDGTVTIDGVTASQLGWIVIHADADGGPGPVIGQAQVIVGQNSQVSVEVDLDQATSTLWAMLHVDAATAGSYEFPGEDVPVFDADGNVVMTPFALTDIETEAAAPAAVEVVIVDSSFQKPVINVTIGTTVTWIYQGTFPHTVTADDGSFDSGALAAGGSFSFTFTKAGAIAYYCRIHGGAGGQGMSGIVNVAEY